MKILYLCNKKSFLTKMSRVRFHGMQAISNMCDVTWSGMHWENYDINLTVQENIDIIYSGDQPDLVVAFKPLELKEFSKIKSPKCLRYNEMYDVDWTIKEIKESAANILVCHHLNDMLQYQEMFSKDKELSKIKLINIPHSAEKTIFKKYDVNKNIDILLVGSIGYESMLGDHYPLRTRMTNILQKMPKSYKCGYYPHPGGIHHDAATDKYAREFAIAINSAKICITDSGIPKSRFGKYVEVPMCETALAADIPGEQEDLFREFVIEIDTSMSDQKIITKLVYYLENHSARKAAIQKGLEYARDYTQEKYAKRFVEEIKNAIS